jgi:hypothetical protein
MEHRHSVTADKHYSGDEHKRKTRSCHEQKTASTPQKSHVINFGRG